MPENKIHSVYVTCAIIEDDGKYLITQRPEGSHNGLRWEFPGGTIKPGEDPRKCLKREIKEEMDLEVRVGDIFEISSNVYDKIKHVVLLGFHCYYVSGKIKKKDVNDYRWVTLKEMEKFDITEADIPLIEALKKRK